MVTRRRRAVFLDRDGVLNRALVRQGKPFAPRRLRDFRLLPGAKAAVAALKGAGFVTIVVTNQPDVGNGFVAPATLGRMHQELRARVPIDDIRVCPHRQGAGCACRKPKPGLLLAAARTHHINLKASYMVGDRVSDVLAGKAAGCYTVLIDRGYAETNKADFHADAIARSLPGAARHILSLLGRRR